MTQLLIREHSGYRQVLVATDFSSHANAAWNQAVWLARQSGARLTLTHTLPDLRRAVHSVSCQAKMDLLYGEGSVFEREVRRASDAKLSLMVAELHAPELNVTIQTLLGPPAEEIIHAVQQGGHGLVLAGTRGSGSWEQFFVGSTAKRLIRKCPSSVWIVKSEHAEPPRVVLAATDFSDVSRRAVQEGLWVAMQASAEFHLLHVIDSTDISETVRAHVPDWESLRSEINADSEHRLNEFVESMNIQPGQVHRHAETVDGSMTDDQSTSHNASGSLFLLQPSGHRLDDTNSLH